jgi:hypothetical protein
MYARERYVVHVSPHPEDPSPVCLTLQDSQMLSMHQYAFVSPRE